MRPAPILLVLTAGALLRTGQPSAPRHWVDPVTGHRIIRLSEDPGSSTLYFHDDAFSADGDKLNVRTPKGIAVADVAKLGSDLP